MNNSISTRITDEGYLVVETPAKVSIMFGEIAVSWSAHDGPSWHFGIEPLIPRQHHLIDLSLLLVAAHREHEAWCARRWKAKAAP